MKYQGFSEMFFNEFPGDYPSVYKEMAIQVLEMAKKSMTNKK